MDHIIIPETFYDDSKRLQDTNPKAQCSGQDFEMQQDEEPYFDIDDTHHTYNFKSDLLSDDLCEVDMDGNIVIKSEARDMIY
jgi:hypothetical protein